MKSMHRLVLLSAYASAAPKTTKATPTVKSDAPAVAAPTKSIGSVGVVAIPQRKTNRGGKGFYDYDSLTAVGMSFGVSGIDKKSVQSAISGYNKKFKVPAKDEAGAVILKDGKPTYTYTRHVRAIAVDAEIAAAVKGSHLEGFPVIVERDI